jgi:site-specific DNA-methyltransferase (adenine-specific)
VDFDSISEAELHQCFAHLAPAVRYWLVSFLDWRHVAAMDKTPPPGLRFVRFGVWTKPNGAPQFTGDRPGQGWEALAFLHRAEGRMVWNGGGATAVYNYPKVEGNHRTAKPPRLIAKLIEQFSNRGDLILDPFAGGGVVLHTAQLLGRRAVGVERDPVRCADIVAWLEAGRLPKVPRTVAPLGPLFDEVAL